MSTDPERVANCRSCNAEVVFRLNPKTGKAPPYDYPPETCAFCGGDGRVAWDGGCPKCHGEGKLWVSHFATCPSAAKWKGKARGR